MGELLLLTADAAFGRAFTHHAARAWKVTAAAPAGLTAPWGAREVDPAQLAQVAGIVREVDPDVVVNALVLPPDLCQADPALARRIHVDGARVAATAAAGKGAKLVHVTSAHVFDGAKGWYPEEADPDPAEEAGRTLLAGEAESRRLCRTLLQVRLPLLLGADASDPVWRATREVLAGRPASLRADLRSNYLVVDEAARLLVEMVERSLSGLYHLGGSTLHTQHDLAAGILILQGGDPHDLGHDAGPLPPRDLSLDPAKAMRNLGEDPRSVLQGLDRWLARADGA